MKKAGCTLLLLLCVAAIGCSSYSCTTSGPFSDRINSRINFNEKLEKKLLEYISKRTVRIILMGKILDANGNLVKDYRALGHGTGAILHSDQQYSYIQTANHVAKKVTRIINGYIVVIDRLKFEIRNINNEIVKTYYIKKYEVIADKSEDIAIIKVPINLGVCSRLASKASLGQNIRILAYPSLLGLDYAQLSYSKGYVGTTNISKENTSIDSNYYFRLCTFGYFGSSGSAIWNTKGEIVGVTVSMSGYRIFGLFIPLQDSLYGKRVSVLRKFYIENKLFDLHL